ncbi:MAG: serine hydrolase [Bacteroidia bacterium]|nr:serine hydrolase [Bacteroidia bacterium]
MQKLIKFGKRLALTLGIVLLVLVGYIYLSGNTYMFFMIKHTVFKGRLGPTIDEYPIYHNREVKTLERPFEWPLHYAYTEKALTETEEAYHNQYSSSAFVVIKKGQLVFEQYWDRFSDTSRTNSWSMAKSIVGHMVGCALKDGDITSLDEPIGNYLKEYKDDTVTIRDLLMMSAGYNFYESYIDPFGYTARTLYGDDLKKAHERYELVDESGTEFNYKSAITQLLGFVVEEATGKNLSEYATEKLWKPIGASRPALWSLDDEGGHERAYCCFNSTARDFAKFGFLYLNKGIVGTDTLIDLEYFEQATKPTDIKLLSGKPNDRYGYQWWCSSYEGEDFFYARGLNGQYTIVLPASQMIIVRLGETQPKTDVNGHRTDLAEYIKMSKRLGGLSSGG